MTSKEWKICKLGNIIKLIGGGTPKTSISEYWNGNIPWISVKDFNNDNKKVYVTEKTITKLGLNKSATKLLQKGDIIISARGTVGEIAVVSKPMAFNQSCYGIKAIPNIVQDDFLYYLLKNSIQYLKHNTHGSVFDTITKETFEKIDILLPPLEVQEKIAEVLSSLDNKIELNNRINNNLEQQVLSLYKNTILIDLDKSGTIGDYCCVKSGFAFKSSWWTKKGLKVIKIKNIDNDKINLTDCSYVSNDKLQYATDFIANGGDLLIAMTGATIGKFAIVPKTKQTLLVNQRVGKFFLGDNPIDKLPYLYCTLKQPDIYNEIVNRGQGSAQPNISSNDIMTISCVYPNIDIIDKFNSMCKPYFQTMINHMYENEQLADLRDMLLPKLMSGEIDVENVDISADKLSFS